MKIIVSKNQDRLTFHLKAKTTADQKLLREVVDKKLELAARMDFAIDPDRDYESNVDELDLHFFFRDDFLKAT